MKLLVTSVGGPAGNNVVQCFKLADPNCFIVGTDVDKYMLQLSDADVKAQVHHSTEATQLYVADLKQLMKTHSLDMVYPQSDREVFVCASSAELRHHCFLPKLETIILCRDKLKCNHQLRDVGVPVPESSEYKRGDPVNLHFPVWARARLGAGGWLATKCQNLKHLEHWTQFHWQNKSSIQFMVSDYLHGSNFSWTAVFNDGKLVTSALKKRVSWVYRRIGTTAVQTIVHNNHICDVCESALQAIDKHYTGLVMVDLVGDKITEVNAGRIGTTGNQFALMSKQHPNNGNNWYNNFPYLAYNLFMGENPTLPTRNALPKGLMYIRHLDMGHKIVKKEEINNEIA